MKKKQLKCKKNQENTIFFKMTAYEMFLKIS